MINWRRQQVIGIAGTVDTKTEIGLLNGINGNHRNCRQIPTLQANDDDRYRNLFHRFEDGKN